MGVAIPEEFRRELAMAGDWQTLSETPIYEGLKNEEGDEDAKHDGLNLGVRKRKYEGQEEEEEAGETVVRRGWGSTTRTFPGSSGEGDDLDALLGTAKVSKRRTESPSPGSEPHEARPKPAGSTPTIEGTNVGSASTTKIKREGSFWEDEDMGTLKSRGIGDSLARKPEEDLPISEIVFKKRKSRITK